MIRYRSWSSLKKPLMLGKLSLSQPLMVPTWELASIILFNSFQKLRKSRNWLLFARFAITQQVSHSEQRRINHCNWSAVTRLICHSVVSVSTSNSTDRNPWKLNLTLENSSLKTVKTNSRRYALDQTAKKTHQKWKVHH